MIQKFQSALLTLAIIVVTSIVPKLTWHEHLKALEMVTQWAAENPKARTLPAA